MKCIFAQFWRWSISNIRRHPIALPQLSYLKQQHLSISLIFFYLKISLFGLWHACLLSFNLLAGLDQ